MFGLQIEPYLSAPCVARACCRPRMVPGVVSQVAPLAERGEVVVVAMLWDVIHVRDGQHDD